MIQPMSLQHGSRTLNGKKEGLNNSSMFQQIQSNKAH